VRVSIGRVDGADEACHIRRRDGSGAIRHRHLYYLKAATFTTIDESGAIWTPSYCENKVIHLKFLCRLLGFNIPDLERLII
jgi:hypothetical protein